MDYTIYYKTQHKSVNDGSFNKYDLFFSGFDCCKRTKSIYDEINATLKVWFVFPQYTEIDETEYSPYSNVYSEQSYEEDTYFEKLIDKYLN